MKKWIPRLVLFGIVAAATAFVAIKRPWSSGKGQITFSTVTVTKGTIAAQVTANGTLSALNTIQVGAQVSGKITELDADYNSHVKKGQIIAKIDESVLRAQLGQAQASYDLAVANEHKAEVALMDADRQYKRQQGLLEQKLIAAQTVETYQATDLSDKAALEASKAQVEQAKENLDQVKTNLSYATIVSPVDGVVLSRAVDVGQTVASSFSAPTLFTIAEDLSRMQIDTAVAEGDVGQLKANMKATFTVDAFPGKTFDGVVRQVRNSPTTTQGVVTYDAVIDVDNKDGVLRPGMTANVTFVLAQVDNAVKIPNAALRFKPSRAQMAALFKKYGMHRGGHRGSGAAGAAAAGGHGMPGGGMGGGMRPDAMSHASGGGMKGEGDRKPLFKLVDGKPQLVFVQLGLTDGSSTQLVEGKLQAGDQLITDSQGLPATTRKLGAF